MPDVKAYDTYGKEVGLPPFVLPERLRNMPSQLAHHIRTGEPVYKILSLSENMKIMSLLDAAIRAAESGKAEKVQ